MRLEQRTGQRGIEILGIKRRLQRHCLAVDIANAGKLIHRSQRIIQLQHFHNIRGRLNHVILHQFGGGRQTHGRHFGSKGIQLLRFSPDLRFCNIGTSSLFPHHKTLVFQHTDCLTNRAAADIKILAQFRFRRQLISGIQGTGRNISFNNIHKLTI